MANAFKSMPDENVPPPPVRMPMRMSSRLSSWSSAAAMAWAVSRLMAFLASGRLIVMIWMPSVTSTVIRSDIGLLLPGFLGIGFRVLYKTWDVTRNHTTIGFQAQPGAP
ncbi:hypothetical protein D3C78_1222380 [compost metagenome]